MTIRVILIDDHQDIHDAVTALLRATTDGAPIRLRT